MSENKEKHKTEHIKNNKKVRICKNKKHNKISIEEWRKIRDKLEEIFKDKNKVWLSD